MSVRVLRRINFRVGELLIFPPPCSSGICFPPTDIRPTHMQQIKKNSCCVRVANLTGSLVRFFFNFRSKERCGNKRIVLLWRFSLVFENHALYSQLKATKYNWSCKSWWEGILPEASSSIVLKRRTIESRSW